MKLNLTMIKCAKIKLDKDRCGGGVSSLKEQACHCLEKSHFMHKLLQLLGVGIFLSHGFYRTL